jgi:hypothetical protein
MKKSIYTIFSSLPSFATLAKQSLADQHYQALLGNEVGHRR